MIKRALLLGVLACGPASSHSRWANGDPIPEWVSKECCSVAHSHHLDDGAVHEMSDGIHVDGYKYVIPYNKVKMSPDGTSWLFYVTGPNGEQFPPICFFHGMSGT